MCAGGSVLASHSCSLLKHKCAVRCRCTSLIGLRRWVSLALCLGPAHKSEIFTTQQGECDTSVWSWLFLPPCDIFWQFWLVFLRQVTEKHDVMQREWSNVLLIPLHTFHTQVKINSFSRPLPVVIQHLRILGWVVCCIFELSSQVEGWHP